MADRNLELGVIGNCAIAALVDPLGEIVWSCFPRLDRDPVFCALLMNGVGKTGEGGFSIELKDCFSSSQRYLENTAILETTLSDQVGNAIEITDFCPRFQRFGRIYRPPTIIRRVRALSGRPIVTIKIKPRMIYGEIEPEITRGSNHMRFVGPEHALRLTTNAPISYPLESRSFAGRGFVVRAGRRRTGAAGSVRFRPQPSGGDARSLANLGARPVDSASTGRMPSFAPRSRSSSATTKRPAPSSRRSPRRSRGAEHRAQLGLSLLLAAGRLLRRPRAERPGRHADHGGFRPLSLDNVDDSHRRGAPSRLSDRPGQSGCSRGSSRRSPAIAAWAPCASATSPTSRCRTTSMAASSSPAAQMFFDCRLPPQRQCRPLRAAGAHRPAAPQRSLEAGCRPVGIPRRTRHPHLLRGDVLGGVRSSRQIATALGREDRARIGTTRRHIHGVDPGRTPGTRSANSPTSFGGIDARCEPASPAPLGFVQRRRSALPRHARRDRQGLCFAATSSSATPRPTISACRHRLHRLHLLVHRRAGRRGRRDEARALFELCSAAATRRPPVRGHRARRPANSGAIFRRPIPWSG